MSKCDTRQSDADSTLEDSAEPKRGEPLRISLVTRSLTRGGAQVQIAALARGLMRRGHDVHVVVFYAGGALRQELERSGVPVVGIGKTNRWNIVRPLCRLVAHLRTSKCDVVYALLPMENLLSLVAAHFVSVPIVWGMRGASVSRTQYGMASRILYGLQFRLLKRPHAVISNSEAAVAEVSSIRRDIHFVPNGIDCAHFRPFPELRARIRARYSMSDDARLVGIVARLDPMKDHVTFLQAASKVIGQVDSVRIVIAGDGPSAYRRTLETTAAELGIGHRVTWLGEVDDSRNVYNMLDVVVSSSAYGEGFSNSIGEAMACGVAAVVTDVGDSAKIVGDAGTVVPPKTPSALADAIVESLRAERPRAGESRRARIVENFSLEAMISRSERVLAQVAARDG